LTFTLDVKSAGLIVKNEFNLTEAEKTIRLYSLIPAAKAFQFLGITSPVVTKIALFGGHGLRGFFRDSSQNWIGPPEGIDSRLSQNITAFTEESSSDELIGHIDRLLERIVDRLANVFGLWRM
jgi:hypothetical protein